MHHAAQTRGAMPIWRIGQSICRFGRFLLQFKALWAQYRHGN
jgi:hypothetical protein